MQNEEILTQQFTKEQLEQGLADLQAKTQLSGLTEGRIVHYVLSNGEHRAAIVVRVFEAGKPHGLANLIVFSDGSNDKGAVSGNASEQGIFWATSAHYDPEGTKHHTWHWIERA